MKNNLAVKIFALLGLLFVQLTPVMTLAQSATAPQTTEQRCQNFKNQFKLGNGTSVVTNRVFCSASELILFIIQYIQGISGIVTVLFLMFGGFLYVSSAGNDEQAEKGRKILTNSVIGLSVIILSYAIVRIVGVFVTQGK